MKGYWNEIYLGLSKGNYVWATMKWRVKQGKKLKKTSKLKVDPLEKNKRKNETKNERKNETRKFKMKKVVKE